MPDEETSSPPTEPEHEHEPPAPSAQQPHRSGRIALYAIVALIALVASALVAQALVGATDSDAQRAYDAGVEYAERRLDQNCELLRIGKADLDSMIASGNLDGARDTAQERVATANAVLMSEAQSQGHSSSSNYFLGGWWDALTVTCPDAFYDPQITGRPDF